MGGEAKAGALFQKLEEDRLADVLGVLGVVEVGVGQAEDEVGVGLCQALCLPGGPG